MKLELRKEWSESNQCLAWHVYKDDRHVACVAVRCNYTSDIAAEEKANNEFDVILERVKTPIPEPVTIKTVEI